MVTSFFKGDRTVLLMQFCTHESLQQYVRTFACTSHSNDNSIIVLFATRRQNASRQRASYYRFRFQVKAKQIECVCVCAGASVCFVRMYAHYYICMYVNECRTAARVHSNGACQLSGNGQSIAGFHCE